jgi:hypothetical protein
VTQTVIKEMPRIDLTLLALLIVSAITASLSDSQKSRASAQFPSLLTSWKEIAQYMDRGVRTLQRWERELQLPVHRISEGKKAPVYAVLSELKFWMLTSTERNTSYVAEKEKMPPISNLLKREAQLTARFNELAKAVAQASVRHHQQAEALEKNILALRSRFSLREAK